MKRKKKENSAERSGIVPVVRSASGHLGIRNLDYSEFWTGVNEVKYDTRRQIREILQSLAEVKSSSEIPEFMQDEYLELIGFLINLFGKQLIDMRGK